MLDQVLIAQASLQTLRVLTNLALVSAALLAVGGAGIWLTSGRPTAPARAARLLAKAAFGLGGLGLGALVVILVLALIPRRPEQYAWTVDLRTEAPLQPFANEQCATWGAGERRYNECIYEGQTSLSVAFPGDRRVVQRGRALWASGREGRLISLHHFLEPMTLAEVRTTLDPIVADWHLRREHVDDWLARAATEERASYFSPADENRSDPWLELSVRPLDSRRGGERVYAVSTKWHWREN
jgi:hypothetical protein